MTLEQSVGEVLGNPDDNERAAKVKENIVRELIKLRQLQDKAAQ